MNQRAEGRGQRAEVRGVAERRAPLRSFFCALRSALCALILVSCATQPQQPQLTAPDWTTVPSGVLDAFCARLQMDAIATGAPLAVVSTTRPLANPQSLNALATLAKGRVKGDRVALSAEELNRSLPVASEGAACPWRPIAASQLNAHQDEMVVELSAPAINPFAPKSGGMFGRVTVGGQGAAWYWITLVPRSGRWVVGPVYVLVQ